MFVSVSPDCFMEDTEKKLPRYTFIEHWQYRFLFELILKP